MSIWREPLVFVDIETNGLSPATGRVIEVAAIRVENGQITGTLDQLLDPGVPIPAFITNLTGITQDDVAEAPAFFQIASELQKLLEGAIFVAHNVRFDYSFLKQEFKRVSMHLQPRQLCTMRLSRALYPQERSHKLQSLIERHGFAANRRHRAYDDAQVLWDFLRHAEGAFDAPTLQAAIARQLKQPSLPKNLQPESVASLPDGPGVYIFEDKAGYPLYIGKSVHVKQRVQAHFTSDHADAHEFKIAQQVATIRVHETAGELGALLLESRLIKEIQPLYNKRLRRTQKLLLATYSLDDNGYGTITLEETPLINPEESAKVLGIYPTRSKAKQAIELLVKDFSLCPKLSGLEKSVGACFSRQLRKCRGACEMQESADIYNARLLDAFVRQRIQAWPYSSAILITEDDGQGLTEGVIVDKWCVVGHLSQQQECEPVVRTHEQLFDVDTYKILQAYLLQDRRKAAVKTISPTELQTMLA